LEGKGSLWSRKDNNVLYKKGEKESQKDGKWKGGIATKMKRLQRYAVLEILVHGRVGCRGTHSLIAIAPRIVPPIFIQQADTLHQQMRGKKPLGS